MAIGSTKVILLIGFGLSAFVAQAQTRPDPVESKVEVEVRAPIVKVAPGDYSPIMVIKGPCKLTNQQKDIVWKNALEAVADEYPEHSKYCEPLRSLTRNQFLIVNDICLASVPCAKTVDGVEILHGNFIVGINETTYEVRVLDVAW